VLLHDVESRIPVRLGHGGKVEDLLDEEIRGRARRHGQLAEVNEFGRSLAEHLNPEHAR